MCGIAGIVCIDSQEELTSRMRTMLKFLERRGPDSQDNYATESVVLGHTRLAVIDLSTEANQPFHDPETGNVLIFNGEIYNFIELKNQLSKEGVGFKTNSDTEVLIKGFAHWGIDKLLSLLEGMFAFAIYQPNERQVYLARDRFGKKPLYYYYTPDQLVFCSDINAIKSSLKKPEVNYGVLEYYLHEYATPQPHTIWKGVKQLPKASWMKLDMANMELNGPRSYWKLDNPIDDKMPLEDCLEQTEHLLKLAIKKRLVSDVPLGFFLSGGIDSSLIVALASEVSDKPVNTFTVGFDDKKRNEMPQARLVADRFGTNHNEIFLNSDIVGTAEKMISYMGEPMGDYSIIPSHHVCEAIKGHATVALSGDGGDELFAGYKHYGHLFRAGQLKKKYGSTGAKLAINMSKVLSRLTSNRLPNMGRARYYIDRDDPMSFTLRMNQVSNRPLSDTLESDYLNQSQNSLKEYFDEVWADVPGHYDIYNKQQYASLNNLLLNNYLVKVDRASMYNSLEVRSPFLDHKLAEFAFSIPNHLKMKGYHTKYVLKKIACEKLGRNVFIQPKRGFSIPLEKWLRSDLKNWSSELLFDSLAQRGIFKESYLSGLWNEFCDQRLDHTDAIWKLIALELWFQKCYES